MLFCEMSLNNRSHSVQDVFARQIVTRRNLGLSRGLLMPLRFHYAITGTPQLDTCLRMHNVVRTVVEGAKASYKPAVSWIRYGVHLQPSS